MLTGGFDLEVDEPKTAGDDQANADDHSKLGMMSDPVPQAVEEGVRRVVYSAVKSRRSRASHRGRAGTCVGRQATTKHMIHEHE